MSASFRPWSDLSEDEQFQLVNLLLSLKAFAAGFGLLERMAPAEHTPLHDFLFAAADFHYHAYYPTSAQMGVPGVLRMLRSEDLYTEIETLLNGRVLHNSFRTLNRFFRNRRLAHPSFKTDAIGEHFFEGTSDEYAEAQDRLGVLTVKLLESLRQRYPESKDLNTEIETRSED